MKISFMKWIIAILLLGLVSYASYFFSSKLKNSINNIPNIPNYTGSSITSNTGNIISESNYTLFIFSGNYLKYSSKELSYFPKVKFNRFPDEIKLFVTIDFNDWFKRIGNDYTTANGFGYALNIFFDNFNNGGFYNVYRKTNGGVANDLNSGLDGRVAASELNGGYTWEIPLDDKFIIASSFEEVVPGYQYKRFDPVNYISKNLGKEMTLGVYLSSVRDVEGWKLMEIKDMHIEYYGLSGDVEVIR